MNDTQYDLYNVLIDCGLSSRPAMLAVTQPIIGICMCQSLITRCKSHAIRLALQSVSAVLSSM